MPRPKNAGYHTSWIPGHSYLGLLVALGIIMLVKLNMTNTQFEARWAAGVTLLDFHSAGHFVRSISACGCESPCLQNSKTGRYPSTPPGKFQPQTSKWCCSPCLAPSRAEGVIWVYQPVLCKTSTRSKMQYQICKTAPLCCEPLPPLLLSSSSLAG